ncbi:MAG: thermonuclease family protein [Desulfosarcina sp.]
MRWRKSTGVCLTLILLTVAIAGQAADRRTWVKTRWVVDGDTIVLADGQHVRYIGIDTPEIEHREQPAEPMGDQAGSVNRQLVDGWQLRLVYDREKKDRYGRTLAFVYRSDGLFVNAELLKRGCAFVLYRFPNTANKAILLSAQREAMGQGRGIWAHVDKADHPFQAYLGNRRSRRFHAHDCKMGQKISRKNRVRFENQWAAFWAGYAPARECIAFPAKASGLK